MRVDLAKWGNSAAVRIPKQILERLNIAIGDALDLSTGEDGCIYIMPLKGEHRKIKAAKGVTAKGLFAGYHASEPIQAWSDEDMLGAERDAWR